MSGFVPKRVSMTRTAMGSTDANSSGKNGHSIVSTIGRRSTLRNKIQSRSFGSMWQIDYMNAAGNKCLRENLVPARERYTQLTIEKDTAYSLTIVNSGVAGAAGTSRGFVKKSLQEALAKKYPGVYKTDRYCALGAINNNVEKIVIGSGTYGSASSTKIVGREIVCIGRLMDGTGYPGIGALQPQSVVIGFSGKDINAPGAQSNCPDIKFNGTKYAPQTIGSASAGPIEYNNSSSNAWKNGTNVGYDGIKIGDFTIVLYGPNGGPPGTGTDLDEFFNTNFDANNEKKFSFEIVSN
jgi:hypothetical protein